MTEDEKKAIDELTSSVATLTQSVEDMREGRVDEETVQRIANELIEKQAAANPALQRKHGWLPDDVEPADPNPKLGQGRKILHSLHSGMVGKSFKDPKTLAALAKRPEDDVRHFQQTGDRLVILAAAMQRDPRELDFYETEYVPALQALDTATVAEGIEFVPTELSGNLIERINLDLRVAALFPEILMPSNPFEIVGRGVSRIRAGRGVENTGDAGQTNAKKMTPATRKITLRAGKFEGEMLVSKEAEEDTIVPMLSFMEEELVDYLTADIEDAILNGDTAGVQDSDTNAANDPRLNFDGLRKKLIAGGKTDWANVAATVALLRGNRGKMGKYGIKPSDLVHIVSMNSYIQLLGDPTVLTMEKYGPMATIVTGELGKADGVPIVVSEYVRTDLNAAGVFDNVTTNRTEALTVNTRGWLRGVKRELEVQILRELYAEADQDAIIVRQRRAFVPRFPTATEKVVAAGYNAAT